MKRIGMSLLVVGAVLAISCADALTPGGLQPSSPPGELTSVHVDRHYLKDELGRYVHLNGVNVSGTSKLPVSPAPGDDPRVGPVSFVGRPFPLEEAPHWFQVLKGEFGFNSIRLVVMWEAVEHEGRGIYDQEYLDYLEGIVAAANDAGVYVVMNFHENLFSRFFYNDFSRKPAVGSPGDVEYMLATLFPDKETLTFDGRVTGDGAPRWAVEACVPEKNIDAPTWGMSKLLSNLGDDFHFFQIMTYAIDLLSIVNVDDGLDEHGYPEVDSGEESGPSLEEFLLDMIQAMKAAEPSLTPFSPTDTCDVYPLTNWWNNVLLSYDVERCYGAFYAGDRLYPGVFFDTPEGRLNMKEYLQNAYINSWLQVVQRVKKYPNVIGYDLVNEPPGGFVMLVVQALYFASQFDKSVVEDFLVEVAGAELGESLYRLVFLLDLLPLMPEKDYFIEKYIPQHKTAYQSYKTNHPELCLGLTLPEGTGPWDCPLDTLPEGNMPTAIPAACEEVLLEEIAEACWEDEFYTQYELDLRASHGIDGIDVMGTLDLNLSFVVYLVDLYRRLGEAIVAEHPEAIIWLEEGGGALDDLVGSAFGNVNLYKPEELDQIVFTPHWYPDIYPYLGFNEPPREFVIEEWEDRDFSMELGAKMDAVLESFGSVPVVFGEFGTYFNYNYASKEFWDTPGIEDSVANDYRISAEILNNYYEAFEKLFAGRMLWCFSVNNSYSEGDLWNYEDFSIMDPEGNPRADLAWCRPYPRFLSGKPLETYFNSDFHYYDSDKGEVDPWREFYLRMGGKETDAPTEIFVPRVQYGAGFYVWLSDGWCTFDSASNTLYWYPSDDAPGVEHELVLRPVQDGRENLKWNYYFSGDQMLVGDRH